MRFINLHKRLKETDDIFMKIDATVVRQVIKIMANGYNSTNSAKLPPVKADNLLMKRKGLHSPSPS